MYVYHDLAPPPRTQEVLLSRSFAAFIAVMACQVDAVTVVGFPGVFVAVFLFTCCRTPPSDRPSQPLAMLYVRACSQRRKPFAKHILRARHHLHRGHQAAACRPHQPHDWESALRYASQGSVLNDTHPPPAEVVTAVILSYTPRAQIGVSPPCSIHVGDRRDVYLRSRPVRRALRGLPAHSGAAQGQRH